MSFFKQYIPIGNNINPAVLLAYTVNGMDYALRDFLPEILIHQFLAAGIKHIKYIYQLFEFGGDVGLMDIQTKVCHGLGDMVKLSGGICCVDLDRKSVV